MDSARGEEGHLSSRPFNFSIYFRVQISRKKMQNAVLPSTPPGGRDGRLCNCHMITPTPSAIVSTSDKYKIHSTVADLGFLVCAKL